MSLLHTLFTKGESETKREQVIRPRSNSLKLMDVAYRSAPCRRGSSKTPKLSSGLCMWASLSFMLFLGLEGGEGLGKIPRLLLDSRRLSAPWSKPAPSEARRLAWLLPIISHLPNGSSKQMFHFLFRRQTYWTGSFNLKTQQHYPNLWKTCQVRKIAFIRNQLILCIYNLFFWIFQFRTGLKENRMAQLWKIKNMFLKKIVSLLKKRRRETLKNFPDNGCISLPDVIGNF